MLQRRAVLQFIRKYVPLEIEARRFHELEKRQENQQAIILQMAAIFPSFSREFSTHEPIISAEIGHVIVLAAPALTFSPVNDKERTTSVRNEEASKI